MASAIGTCCIPQVYFHHSWMVEVLKAFPANVGRLCIPCYVYTMNMVTQGGGWSGTSGRAGWHHQFQRPCRWVPRDGNVNPLCRPSLDLSRLCNLGLLSWRFPGGQRSRDSCGRRGSCSWGVQHS